MKPWISCMTWRYWSLALVMVSATVFVGCRTMPASNPATGADPASSHPRGEESCPDTLPLAPPNGSVNDFASSLSAEEIAGLKAEINEIQLEGLAEMLIYVSPALPSGEMLEDLTLCAANAWGVGNADTDNGIIIFVFMADRKIRIELGFGAARSISNDAAARIIEENMAPLFRQAAYGEGLKSAIRELRRLLAIGSSEGPNT